MLEESQSGRANEGSGGAKGLAVFKSKEVFFAWLRKKTGLWDLLILRLALYSK